jgi:hypothetical protein
VVANGWGATKNYPGGAPPLVTHFQGKGKRGWKGGEEGALRSKMGDFG